MIIDIFYNLLKRRHFWRYASFSEIAELYMSRTIRIVAVYVATGFTSVYLFKEGYSLTFILICWACYYVFKIPQIFLAAYLAAKIGPKHGIMISNLLYIPAMISIGFVPNFGLPAIIIWAMFTAFSTSIYQLCYMIDFSKIKNVEHAGKEIAVMNIFEKFAISLSPIAGGLVALFFGPQVVMWVAAVLFLLAALPLLKTSEQVSVRQKINFRGFPWRMATRSLIAQSGIGFDYITTGVIWGLFITIAVLSGSGNAIYVDLGILSSVTILVAIVTSYAYGRLIDRKKGGNLLKFSVIANAFVHVSRAFSLTPASVVVTNVTNEMATTGYNMAFMRGMFDTADLSGHRIVYMCASEFASVVGALIGCLIAIGCITMQGDIDGMKVFFLISAAAVLIIGTAKFQLYRK